MNLRKNNVNNKKLKMDDLNNSLIDELIIIKDLSDILTSYIVSDVEKENSKITTLVFLLNEKIENYKTNYYNFKEFLFKEM